MTNEQINRAVAEELGWRPHDVSDDHWFRRDGSLVKPDFCEDHNAAAEMRKAVKTEDDRIKFDDHIDNMTGGYLKFDLINATPRQQAEAFLRLRGKWREE